jgi:intergrase/recombinase
LLGKREFTRDQGGYYIKSRLLKKVKALFGTELPLIQNLGLIEGLATCSKNLAAGCKVSSGDGGGSDLVAQPGRTSLSASSLDNVKSPRWDLNPRPKVFAHSPPPSAKTGRAMDYETFAASYKVAEDSFVIHRSSSYYTPSPPSSFCDWLQSQGKTRNTIKETANYANDLEVYFQMGMPLHCSPYLIGIKHHALTALANLAKYQGCYDQFMQIRQRYSLKWSKSDSGMQAFQGFFSSLDFDSMLAQIKEMIRVLPANMGAIIKFACITGLRPSEAIESVKLLNEQKVVSSARHLYYNPEHQALEHFRFPTIFMRRTKNAYVSFITQEQLSAIGILGCKTTTWNAIRLACRRRNIHMDMRYCRKLFATHLRQSGISAEIIDALQGRMPASIFARHYYHPSLSYKNQVLQALEKLQSQLG